MGTVTASALPSRGAASIVVDWTSSPSVSGISLVRVTPDSVQTAVRNSPVVASVGRAVFWDAEMPLNTVIYYIASSPQVTGTLTSNSITVSGYGWIGDPYQPALDAVMAQNVRMVTGPPTSSEVCDAGTGITIGRIGDQRFNSLNGVFSIIGARRPRIISQIRPDYSSQITFETKQTSDSALLNALFGTGDVLCVRLDPTLLYDWAPDTYGVRYINAMQVDKIRPGLDQMNWPNREWVVPHDVVDAPTDTGDGQLGGNGIGVTGSTYTDLAAGGRTYQNVVTDGVTYQQVALGTF